MTLEMPAHKRLDIDAVCRLIQRSIEFSNWAAGEGICPGSYKDPRRAEKNPDEFLFAYEKETQDDEWLNLHRLLKEAFKSLEDENGKLKCEINQYAWERDMARRERDEAIANGPSYLDFITPDEVFDRGPDAVKGWQEKKAAELDSSREG